MKVLWGYLFHLFSKKGVKIPKLGPLCHIVGKWGVDSWTIVLVS